LFMWLTSVPVAGCHEQHLLSGSIRGRYLIR